MTTGSGIFIDFNNGRVLSTANWGSTLSGNYASKEYNTYVSNEEDTDFYLESLYQANQDLSYTATGVVSYEFAAPCIILTNATAQNQPWAMGGLENSKTTLRAFAISNNPYNQEALAGLLRDRARSYFPLVSSAEMPLAFYGNLKTGHYSYCDIMALHGCTDVFIKDVYVYKLSNMANKSEYFSVSVIDFDVETVRYPRT